jgi:Flp pilus assembly pilin Flp
MGVMISPMPADVLRTSVRPRGDDVRGMSPAKDISLRFWNRALTLGRRLVCEDAGQDLIEYALLTTFIGLSSIAAWDLMQTAIHNAYVSLNNDVDGLWEPPAPSGSGS